MNPASIESNVLQIRSSQILQENQNSLIILDESNALSYMANQILDFPQRIKIASDFMASESQVLHVKRNLL